MAREKQFKAKDKITHKMTRDGLVERNETQGTQQRVSMRGQDFRLDKAPAAQVAFLGRDAPAADTRRRRAAPQGTEAPDFIAAPGVPPEDAARSPIPGSDTSPDFPLAQDQAPLADPTAQPPAEQRPSPAAGAEWNRNAAAVPDPGRSQSTAARPHTPAGGTPTPARQGRKLSVRLRGVESSRGDAATNRPEWPDTAERGPELGTVPMSQPIPDSADRPLHTAAGKARRRPSATDRFTMTHQKQTPEQHSGGRRLRMEGDRQDTGGTKPSQRGTSYSQKFMEKGQDAASAINVPGELPQSPDVEAFRSVPGTVPPSTAAPQTGGKPPDTASSKLRHRPATTENFTRTHPKSARGQHSPAGKLRLEGDKPEDTGKRKPQRGSAYSRKFAEKEQDAAAPAPAPQATASDSTSTNPDRPPERHPCGAKLRTEGDAPAAGDRTTTSRQHPAAPSRLQFTADEKPPEPLGKKLTKARRKADRTAEKLVEAKEKLPTRKRVRLRTAIDPQSGEIRRGPRIETEVKTRRQHLRGPVPLRPVKAVGNTALRFGHQKMREVEHENVGVEAAHKGEVAAETLLRFAYRRHKLKPYRRVARLEKQAVKSGSNAAYQQLLHDNPELRKKHLSKAIQKQKIKRKYAKAYRDAKRAGTRLQRTKDVLAKAGKAVVGFIRRHPVAIGIALALLLVVCVFTAMLSSCSSIAGGGMSAVFASSYTADDTEMESAASVYSEWETNMLLQIQTVEDDRPGYDEYRYNVGHVGHNPHELMAYLTAKFGGFTYSQVVGELWSIFEEQYTLEIWEEVEERSRVEYYYDEDGYLQSEVVYYDYYILNINLAARSFSDVIAFRMDSAEREHFDRVIETGGNRQYALSPFPFDWYPYISEQYGWRIHPITGEKDNHLGIDIAVETGTQILAAHSGTVTAATWHDQYGFYVVVDDGDGLQTKYAHCSRLFVSAGQQVEAGSVIALVGSEGESTGPHLHFEVIKNGEYRNPLFFAETVNDGTRGAAPGTPGGPDLVENPRPPMASGSVADLLEEAYRHLGKPYVFGAVGPDYFDCSGYVSYVLNQSGVAPVGRLGAQALYNRSAPISGAQARAGDLVFFHSTYSTTTTVTHVGIYLGDGRMIHCGDPIQIESVNTSYWQNHFYAFGRLN